MHLLMDAWVIFSSLAIVKNETVNIGEHVSGPCVQRFGGIHPGVCWPDHAVILGSTFGGMAELVSMWPLPVYISINHTHVSIDVGYFSFKNSYGADNQPSC